MGEDLLIIDDDPLHHKRIEMLIKKLHPEIRHKSFLDASEALLYISNVSTSFLPDLILLDLTMPVVTGWGFLDVFEVVQPCLKKNIDIIILTSSISKIDQARASNYSSVKGFFSKPFTELLLNDILNSSFISVNKLKNHLNGLLILR